MRGLETLIAMRMRRKAPARGVLVALAHKVGEYLQLPLEPSLEEGIVTLEVDPAESFDRLDLRPLVGLRVAVIDYTENQRALRAFCGACVAAGADEVMGFEYLGRPGDHREIFAHKGWEWQT